MTMQGPASNRGGPMLERAAQDTIRDVRQEQPQWIRPPEYERADLTPEDRAEAAREPVERVCGLCAGYHHMPSTAACPRLASFELDGDGKLKSGTFWPGKKWADGRVVFVEDTKEEDDGDEH